MLINANKLCKHLKYLMMAFVLIGPSALMAQSSAEATVEVVDVLQDIPYATDPNWWTSLANRPSPGGEPSDAADYGCQHSVVFYTPSGGIGLDWVNPHNGIQLFYNTFTNNSSVQQSFSQTVSGTVRCTYEGSLTISVACAKVGVDVEVKVSREYPVSIPPHSQLTMTANANMMNRSIEMLVVCSNCSSVLSTYNNWVSAARGINEYFN